RPLDETVLASMRSDLFGRYLEKIELDCTGNGPDQLTRELAEFVTSVRTGAPVRVPGEQGRDALALAGRILDSLRRHVWDGRAGGTIEFSAAAGTALPHEGARCRGVIQGSSLLRFFWLPPPQGGREKNRAAPRRDRAAGILLTSIHLNSRYFHRVGISNRNGASSAWGLYQAEPLAGRVSWRPWSLC